VELLADFVPSSIMNVINPDPNNPNSNVNFKDFAALWYSILKRILL
jgi:hypothetical protein